MEEVHLGRKSPRGWFQESMDNLWKQGVKGKEMKQACCNLIDQHHESGGSFIFNGEKIDHCVVKLHHVERLVKATRDRAHSVRKGRVKSKMPTPDKAEAAKAEEDTAIAQDRYVLVRKLDSLEKALKKITGDAQCMKWLKQHGNARKTCQCYHFTIGRTLAQKGFKKLSEMHYVPCNVNGENRLVYIRNPMEGTKPTWMKELYKEHLLPVAKAIDKEWVGQFNDVVFQVNIMAPRMHVKEHIDSKDISFQYAIGLGEYKGGEFFTTNSETGERVEMSLKNRIVKVDGRHPHGARNTLSGTRYSVFIYKLYDRCWDMTQLTPHHWPPTVVFDMSQERDLAKESLAKESQKKRKAAAFVARKSLRKRK
jgi:hypothetical protein